MLMHTYMHNLREIPLIRQAFSKLPRSRRHYQRVRCISLMHLRRAALFYLRIHRISYGNSLLILTCTQSGEPIAAGKLYLSAIGAARLVNAASTHPPRLVSRFLSSPSLGLFFKQTRWKRSPPCHSGDRAFDLSHDATDSLV